MDDRLAKINSDMSARYASRPGSNRLPRITKNMLASDGWANLHGPTVKAANTRQAAPAFKDLGDRYLGNSRKDVSIKAVLTTLAAIYSIMWDGPMFLDQSSQDSLKQHCLEFGSNYQRLRMLAMRDGELTFQVTTK
eukprot:4972750-Pyramimonas_sp.AAC.1